MPETLTPTSVSRDDYLKAIEPLLDLLGVTAMEVVCPIVIDVEEISLQTVPVPVGLAPDGYVRGQRPERPRSEFGELVEQIRVRIE
jgi:hypothetical protein